MAFPFPFAFWQQSAVAEWNYGFFAGGKTSGGVNQNIIDYIDVTSTTGNATDKGDLSVTRHGLAGSNGDTYGFFGGGVAAGIVNTIDYISVLTTSGNATDKGDLSVTRTGGGACASSSNIFFGGGWAV